MSTKIEVPKVRIDQLIRIIKTGARSPEGPSKVQAILALRRSRSTRKIEVLSALLADREELPRFKHMAVTGLLELGGVRAEEALIENVQYADEFTANMLALALGRVGSPRSVSVVQNLRSVARPAARSQVDFAATLLAYRHDLRGYEVEVPTGDQLLSLDATANLLPVEVSPAPRTEIEAAVRALEREPLGIELTNEAPLRIVCGPNHFLLIWNKDFGGSQLAKLRKRKGVAGVLFLKSRFDNEFSVSAFVLVTPGLKGLRISIHKPWGEAVLAGSADSEEAGFANLVIRSVRRPGAAALEFSGSITDGRIMVERAQSATTVVERRVPASDSHPSD